MTDSLTMGYRTVVASGDTLLAPAGFTVRGHEFHYSDWIDFPAERRAAYRWGDGPDDDHPEGYAAGNLLASYVHLHFGAAPQMAARMVAACRAWAAETKRDA
jgi:cobyrinic acid a,c-diamide synthase